MCPGDLASASVLATIARPNVSEVVDSMPITWAALHGLHCMCCTACVALHGAALHGAALHGATLHGATLHGAALHGAVHCTGLHCMGCRLYIGCGFFLFGGRRGKLIETCLSNEASVYCNSDQCRLQND